MGYQPLISVIIPVYNVEKYLPATIDSVINQTYQNIEIILVDDGTPDKSGEICDAYAEKDSRVRVFHKENGGPSEARNVGLDAAKGEFINFVDGDDIIMPNTLENLVRVALEYQVKMVTYELTEHEEVAIEDSKKDIILSKHTVREALMNPNYATISPCNKLYHKSIWENLRFPLGMFHEDEFVYHYIIDNAGDFLTMNLRLYYYIQRPESTMHRLWKQRILDGIIALEDRLKFIEKYNDDEIKEAVLKDMLSYFIKSYGLIYEQENHRLEDLSFADVQELARSFFELNKLKTVSKTEKKFLNENEKVFLRYYLWNKTKRKTKSIIKKIILRRNL